MDPKNAAFIPGLSSVLAHYGDKMKAAQAIQNAAQKVHNEGKTQPWGSRGVFEAAITVLGHPMIARGMAFPDGTIAIGTVLSPK